MFVLFKSRTHIVVALLVVATLIFILHQMLSNEDEPLGIDIASLKLGQPLNPFNKMPSVINENIINMPNMRTEFTYKLEEPYKGEKLVHLDLKGAPPLPSYFAQIFPLFKKMGATGLLLEYEDMFPYRSVNVSALNAYNKSSIENIISEATRNGLMVIPLIQTFGHLEFVLKLNEYRELRELDEYPQVICPQNKKTLPLLYSMIDSMIELHPGIKYLHIGCDEVYHIGRCERCTRIILERGWSKEQLFLSHVQNITSYINKKYPHIRPIMWDDEFRGLSEELIVEFQIAKMADIMIWKYTPEVAEFITDEILDKYSRLFPGIWIASAFKGATGPDSMIPDVRHYLENQMSWMHLVSRWQMKIHFKGVALTGWQRYDHFAVLCELLPVAVPSLTVCLQYIDGKEVDDNALSKVLGCEFPFAWGPGYVATTYSSSKCEYPGSSLYHLLTSLYITLMELNQGSKDVNRGWFSWYNVLQQYSNPSHVEESASTVDYHRIQLQYLEQRIRHAMEDIYDAHTAEEWLNTFVVPWLTKLSAAAEARQRLLDAKVWPKRPLVSKRSELEKICDGFGSLGCSLLGV